MEAKKIVFNIFFMLVIFQAYAQPELYQKELFIKDLDTLKYRILFPDNFNENEQYPVVLFLHGAGERGNDNEAQLTHGSKLFSNSVNMQNYPAIVIFPQCPTKDYWSNAKIKRNRRPIKLKFNYNKKPTKAMTLVMDLLDETIEKPFINKEQIYVMGLSMGGMGTFELVSRMPKVFAAAVPICGGGQPNSTKEYAKNLPVWVFHGAKDDVVDPQLSLTMVASILKNGGNPQFTLYQNANHNSWDPAFAEPDLLPWLFSKKLK